jgi:hypothetical protein
MTKFVFDSRHDEQFPCGFSKGMVVRLKPLWAMSWNEVVEALSLCEIAMNEATRDEKAGVICADAEQRYLRLKSAVISTVRLSYVEWSKANPEAEFPGLREMEKSFWP